MDNLNTEAIKPLSAKQGKVLKGFIDNINRILISDDTDLDQLQEIVNYIKQNKKILSQLGISNISGLQSALNGKADKVHTHTKSQISDFPTSMPASDVHKRAKQVDKPTYTISEIQGLQEALDNKSSSVASLDRIDFNYTTNLTQKKFRIGSRHQFSNIPHDQGGHQLQVLW
nr:MAG TPA: minor tail protein [Caudoviricetes sp.]